MKRIGRLAVNVLARTVILFALGVQMCLHALTYCDMATPSRQELWVLVYRSCAWRV